MKKILLSVFNEQGNFAAAIDISETVTASDVARILAPHVVSQGATPDLLSVRPMRGLALDEQAFYKLVLATLENANAVEHENKFTAGYGNYLLTAEIIPTEDQFPGFNLSIAEESTGVVVLSTSLDGNSKGVVTATEYRDFVVNKLVGAQQAMAALVNSGTEYLVQKINDWVGLEDISSPAAPEEAKKLQRLNVAQPAQVKQPTLPTKHEVRAKVAEALNEARNGDQERFSVSIPVVISDAKNPSAPGQDRVVLVEVDRTNFDRIGAEGLVTTLVQSLGAVISNNKFVEVERNGYLLKIREAFSDHGIATISITPRDAAFTPDNEQGTGPINIFEV